jgi:hypothetical protein
VKRQCPVQERALAALIAAAERELRVGLQLLAQLPAVRQNPSSMRRQLVIASALGAAYGVIATAVHLVMLRGYLPAPAESSLPLAVVLYVVRAPFIAAIYLSTFALGRSSPTLVELVVEALIFGALAGVLVVLVTTRSRLPR